MKSPEEFAKEVKTFGIENFRPVSVQTGNYVSVVCSGRNSVGVVAGIHSYPLSLKETNQLIKELFRANEYVTPVKSELFGDDYHE